MKRLNITKEQFNRSNYFQRKYGKLEYVSESGKLFKTNKGKVLKFNEGRLADKLNSGELYEKQMPSLGKAIQKFIDSDGRKGQDGTWNIVSDDDGSIKLYEHHGYWVGTIVDGHMKWEDEDGFYVSAKYSEMILNALCDGGLIERDECQRAIEDAYAREGDYEREYGESRRFNEGRGLKFMDDMVAARKAAGQDYATRMSRGRAAYDAKLDKDIPGDFDLKTKEEIKTILPSMRREGFTPEDIVDAYENGIRPNKCERKNGALYIGGT